MDIGVTITSDDALTLILSNCDYINTYLVCKRWHAIALNILHKLAKTTTVRTGGSVYGRIDSGFMFLNKQNILNTIHLPYEFTHQTMEYNELQLRKVLKWIAYIDPSTLLPNEADIINYPEIVSIELLRTGIGVIYSVKIKHGDDDILCEVYYDISISRWGKLYSHGEPINDVSIDSINGNYQWKLTQLRNKLINVI